MENATLKLTLHADSGYKSQQEERVSPDQWKLIQYIIQNGITMSSFNEMKLKASMHDKTSDFVFRVTKDD